MPIAWAAGIGAWFVVCELLARPRGRPRGATGQPRLPGEVARKLAHAGAALAAALGVCWFDHRAFVWLGLAFAALMLLTIRLVPLAALADAQRSWGPVAFGLGGAATAALAPDRPAFVAAVLIMGLADTAAVAVGRTVGIRRLPGGKSLGGAIGFAVVAAVVLLIALPGRPLLAVGLAAVLALVELFTPRGWDNLTVPAVAAAALLAAG
ncbi:dolichol kinase [Naumannella cuiyingiana]|uniref:Dolichol kinase n=1 Tax=Naumannella cuiyingiana TaxID=1347891 RepID=A0A7Z0DA26_9ACTN|nr:hypothetical protein [Naumannella cuiyingiana]NYI71732.1 dolichol kinase [Naumannella cuiyingiana]